MQYLFWRELSETIMSKWMDAVKEDAEDLILFLTESRADKLGVTQMEISQICVLDADLVCGVGFDEGLIRKAGYLNPVLMGDDRGILYEYVCRLVNVCEQSKVVVVSVNEGEENCFKEPAAQFLDDLAFIYAYTARLHMNRLHELGVMDSVFQKICLLMQQKKCLSLFQQYMNIFLSDQVEFEKIAGFTAPFLVLRGEDTFGGILQQFADSLTEALIQNGQAVIELGGKESDYDIIQGMLMKGIVGFQTKALEIDFFQKIHGPRFQFWFDNPLRFWNILRNQPEDYYVLCQDADHAELIRKYYHTPNAIQFPPGGMAQPFEDGDRFMDVIFIGNYFPDDYEMLAEGQKAFYDYMKLHSGVTFEQGYMDMTGEMSVEDMPQVMMELKSACRAVVGHFRNKVITSILNAGISLHVYGDNWKIAPYHDHENLVVHTAVTMKDSLAEFRKAKIGLNIMSWYKSGMTERVANIMLSGAVCLSDETVYLLDNTENWKDIVLYRLEEIDKIPDLIQELLRNEERRKEIAKSGYEKAMREFSWDVRARQLVELAEKMLQ